MNTGPYPQICRVEPLPVKRTGKKYKVFTQPGRYAVLWQPKIWVICCADNQNLRFLSSSEVKLMLFHRGQDAEGSLYLPSIVIADIALDHLDQFLFVSKPPAMSWF